MQFQDLDPSKKLPYIRSSNIKIALLIVFVLFLVVINIFVILYGKNNRNTSQNTPASVLTEINKTNLPDTSSSVQIHDNGAESVLTNFFGFLKDGKIDKVEGLISEYSSRERFETVINEGINYGMTISYKMLGVKFSSQGNYAYITVEFTSNNVVQYQKYTLIKINSQWKLMSIEVL